MALTYVCPTVGLYCMAMAILSVKSLILTVESDKNQPTAVFSFANAVQMNNIVIQTNVSVRPSKITTLFNSVLLCAQNDKTWARVCNITYHSMCITI